jgi:hypothetical protein
MTFNGLHTICIRSSYQDPQLSRYRLDLSRHTMVPSLRQQTCKQFQIYLRIHDDDPCFAERWAMWHSIGVPILRTKHFDCGNGLHLQTRLDDDDAVSRDFVADLQRVASKQSQPRWIVQPHGLLFNDGRWYQMTHSENMFASLLIPGPLRIFQQTHKHLGRIAPRLCVNAGKRCWCWIRHARTASVANAGYTRQPRATPREIQRFAHVGFPAVAQASRAAQ